MVRKCQKIKSKTAKSIFAVKCYRTHDPEIVNTIIRTFRTCNDMQSDDLIRRAAKLGKYIAMAKPLIEGRLELLHYLKEQSIAFEYHRYGSITEDYIQK